MQTSPHQAIARILPIALLATMSGCSGFREPVVTIVNASVTEKSDIAVGLGLLLDLANSNNEPVELNEFIYAVTINGTGTYRGRWSASATLPSNGSRRLVIPAVVRYEQLGWTENSVPAEAMFEVSGTLLYIAPGDIAEILFDTGVRKPTVSFSGNGVLKLAESPGK